MQRTPTGAPQQHASANPSHVQPQSAAPLPERIVVCEPRQSPGEKALGAVGAAGNVVSGLAALLAAFIAVRALRNQIGAPRRDRRAATYHAVVLDLAIPLLRAFEANAVGNIRAAAQEVRAQVAANCHVGDVQQSIRLLVEGYEKQVAEPVEQLVSATNAWGDESLRAHVLYALEQIEDISERFFDLQLGTGSSEPIVEELRVKTAKLLSVLIHHNTDDELGAGSRFAAQ